MFMTKTTMTLKSIFISYIALIIIFTCKCDPLSNSRNIDGFTTDLIHIDDSPLYDPSFSTHSHRLASAVERSRIRAKHFNYSLHMRSRSYAAESIITSASGPYLMKFAIGTPSKQVVAIVDTGSHLTWTQCLPCNNCIKQSFPIFNPSSSISYKDVRCNTYGCDFFKPSSACDKRGEKCIYTAQYGGGSYSHGLVAMDTFAFSSSKSGVLLFNKVVFGCGHNNSFAHVKGAPSGIVGLAGGRSSLSSQLGYDKFAYCLMVWPGDGRRSSKIHFGGDAVVGGGGVTTTPLTERNKLYFLTMEAISVGNKWIKYNYLVANGNIMIDSGGLLTKFPENFYDEFEVALANQIKTRAVRDFEDWRLCYSTRIEMPRITVHFKGGDVEWKFNNVFIRVSVDYVCLAVVPMRSLPIYGSVAQTNYMVGFDTFRETVSFKQTQCGN